VPFQVLGQHAEPSRDSNGRLVFEITHPFHPDRGIRLRLSVPEALPLHPSLRASGDMFAAAWRSWAPLYRPVRLSGTEK
jgi:hypothetical protein